MVYTARDESRERLAVGGPGQEFVYHRRSFHRITNSVNNLEQRKRPIRERLRAPDDELERGIGVLGSLRADKEKQRIRHDLSAQGFDDRQRYLADHDGDRQKIDSS